MPPPPPLPLVALRNATFHTPHRVFPNTTFTLTSPAEKWSVLGPSTPLFLSILQGTFPCSPPTSQSYPLLAAHNQWPQSTISRISFAPASNSLNPGYISARYESLREPGDLTLSAYLGDHSGLDLEKLGLTTQLLEQDLMTLSNGQMRRARIAKALLRKPRILLVEEPWMGLDPRGHREVSSVLSSIPDVAVVLGLRRQDPIPAWSTHAAYVSNNSIVSIGTPTSVAADISKKLGIQLQLESEKSTLHAAGIVEKVWRGTGALPAAPAAPKTPPIVEMENVTVSYPRTAPILANFTWRIHAGEKWGLFGANGSGKTTLTSLITSDHPLAYSLPIRHFGLSRLPTLGKPGVPLSALQARIAVSSPEVHGVFPGYLTLHRCVLSGFAETPLTPPITTPAELEHAEALMQEFKEYLPEGVTWLSRFEDTDLSTQRLALFLKATAPKRELVVFDEAFSGMSERVREACFSLLETPRGWDEGRQALVVVSHVSEEVPRGVTKWVRLGERGGEEKAVFGEAV